MLDPKQWRDAILIEAAGGPPAKMIRRFDPRTGKSWYPGQQRPKRDKIKAKKRRKMAKASRKKNRRKK